MIVVVIIALLAVVAIPGFLRAREQTRKTKFANALRVACDACDLYVTEHNAYPPDVTPGIFTCGDGDVFQREARLDGSHAHRRKLGLGLRSSDKTLPSAFLSRIRIDRRRKCQRSMLSSMTATHDRGLSRDW